MCAHAAHAEKEKKLFLNNKKYEFVSLLKLNFLHSFEGWVNSKPRGFFPVQVIEEEKSWKRTQPHFILSTCMITMKVPFFIWTLLKQHFNLSLILHYHYCDYIITYSFYLLFCAWQDKCRIAISARRKGERRRKRGKDMENARDDPSHFYLNGDRESDRCNFFNWQFQIGRAYLFFLVTHKVGEERSFIGP